MLAQSRRVSSILSSDVKALALERMKGYTLGA
jgi:hypothetical protein